MCISWSCTFWVVKGQGHSSRSKVKKRCIRGHCVSDKHISCFHWEWAEYRTRFWIIKKHCCVVCSSCEGDERTMRQVLDRMGYKPKFPETHRNPSAKGERSTSPAKGKVPMKPAQRETTPKKQKSPAKVAPPAEPELSIGQKSQCMWTSGELVLLTVVLVY